MINAYPLSVRDWDAACTGTEAAFRLCPGAIGAHYHLD